MKKITTFFVLLIASISFSQTNQQSDFWDNVRFGGAFGLNFGSTTHVAISPSAVYDFESGFSLGVGLNYTYSKSGVISRNAYGASVISLYEIPSIDLQLSAEFEQLFVNNNFITTSQNYNYPALYLGASYNTGAFGFGIRYDVLYNDNKSIYASPISPIIRVFF